MPVGPGGPRSRATTHRRERLNALVARRAARATVGWARASTSPARSSPSVTASSRVATTACARSTTARAAPSSPSTRPRRTSSCAPTPAPSAPSTPPTSTEHLQHAYALTAHTIQGGTVEWAGVVGHPDDFTRNWSYTALSRARQPTELFLIDAPTERELDRAEIAPQPARRTRRRANAPRTPRGRHAPPRRRGPRPRPHTHRQHRQRRSGRCQPPAGTRQRGRWKRAAVAVSR